MGVYATHIVPRLTAWSLDRPDVADLRSRVAAHLGGHVLEIGFGSGLNVGHYPPTVSRVTGVEPSAVARRLARARVETSPVAIELAAGDAVRLPFDDASFDSALVTWTLCAVPDVDRAATELHRVLVPGGLLAYLEHGASPDRDVRRRQRQLNTLNLRLGGCRLDRVAPGTLAAAGFVLGDSRTYYLEHAPRWAGYVYEGEATRPG